MKPINVVVRLGASCMLLGAVSGLVGLVSNHQAIKAAAKVLLTMGVAIGFVPLLAVAVHSAYSSFKKRQKRE